jgi:NAD+ kinase
LSDQQPVPPPGPPIAEDRGILANQIAFIAAPTAIANEARAGLVVRYGECPLHQAKVVVALGGDGFMLETIHQVLTLNVPVYGMNRGSVGFLMNTYSEEDLPGRLSRAQAAELHPLRMHAVTATGSVEGHWHSTRSACYANSARRRRSAFPLMGGCGWRNCPATAC